MSAGRKNDFDYIAEAQEELKKVAGLLLGAALAYRSAAHDIVQGPVGEIVKAAEEGLQRALDALIQADHQETGNLHLEVCRLFGLTRLAESALAAPEPVDGKRVTTAPAADALEIAAEVAGEDIDEGLNQRCEALLAKLNIAYVARAPLILKRLSRQDSAADALAADPEQSLVLHGSPPDRKVTVIKVMREITGCSIKEAKDLLESTLPITVKVFQSAEEAQAALEKLEGAGASATVQPSG